MSLKTKIRSAGSAIDLNNASCADSMQGEGKKGWGRKREWERKGGQEMRGVRKDAPRQGGCVSSVCGVSRLIFHVAVCRAPAQAIL